MSLPQISISRIGPESDFVLGPLFDQYVQEMAEWFEVPTNADGSYSYDRSAIWKHGCDAYLAITGEQLAGFVLVGSAAEWSGKNGGHDVHEFYVTRSLRRSGFGQAMAALVWNEHPGEWLVRALEANAGAVLFWRATVSKHSHSSYEEERRIISGRPWRFFRFAVQGACQDVRVAASR